MLSAQRMAQAHPGAFRNIYTRPRLYCLDDGQRTVGATPMPLRLVLWRQHVGTSRAQAQTLVLWTSGCSLLSPSPTRRTAPPPNTVQYSDPGSPSRLLPPLSPCLMLG